MKKNHYTVEEFYWDSVWLHARNELIPTLKDLFLVSRSSVDRSRSLSGGKLGGLHHQQEHRDILGSVAVQVITLGCSSSVPLVRIDTLLHLT